MAIVSIILGILEAIPSLLKAFQEIIALIHGMPLGSRWQAITTFETNLASWSKRAKTEPEAVAAEVHGHALALKSTTAA